MTIVPKWALMRLLVLEAMNKNVLVIIGVVLASVISILFFLLWFGFVGAKCYSESNGVITEIPC